MFNEELYPPIFWNNNVHKCEYINITIKSLLNFIVSLV